MGSTKKAVKILLRSGSLRFTRHSLALRSSNQLQSLRWKGIAVNYRPGTSDAGLIYNILLKRGAKGEYCPPREFSLKREAVKVILDIGANIGVSSIYFSQRFPNAVVHAFEPDPGNFEILRLNTKEIGRVRCHPYALGEADGELSLFFSDNVRNHGGGSLTKLGVDSERSQRVTVKHAGNYLHGLGIDAIDVIKIDTEGAEWEIISSLSPTQLASVGLIMGELHGIKDFALLDYLQPHFNIGLKKNLKDRLFNFAAIPRDR